MDIARPDLLEKKKKKQMIWAGVAAAVVALLTLGVARLKPAAVIFRALLAGVSPPERARRSRNS